MVAKTQAQRYKYSFGVMIIYEVYCEQLTLIHTKGSLLTKPRSPPFI